MRARRAAESRVHRRTTIGTAHAWPLRTIVSSSRTGKTRHVSRRIISEGHAAVAEAFAEIDPLSAEMLRTGAPSNAIELIVVDAERRIVAHPGTNCVIAMRIDALALCDQPVGSAKSSV